MTNESHVAALRRRHIEVERQLQEQLVHKSSNDLEISALKRRKLEIKDELVKLQSNAA